MPVSRVLYRRDAGGSYHFSRPDVAARL